ncbi:MAG: hypothetical protein IJP61_00690 [Treponema sp.]|nr:hypothetical protein [Treponema sp.]
MLNPNENQIFTDYCKNHFVSYNENAEEDASFLDFWRNFSSAINEKGSERAINTLLIPALPVKFNNPDDIFCEIYASVAGEIPVIKIADAEDFEKLVTNLIYKGKRPENLSSTGASFVFGKKTRFIILSEKPYSNVSAKTLGLDEDDWQKKSLRIRLEHECTHFYTKKHFGISMNHLHDELIADFFGISSAFGFYKAEYFEYFMGIKGNEGSRISYYIPDCSENLFSLLKDRASKAALFWKICQKKRNLRDFLIVKKSVGSVKWICSTFQMINLLIGSCTARYGIKLHILQFFIFL